MKAYVCDVCGTTITDPYVAKLKEFYFTISNCDIYQVPQKNKIRTKIHLCNNCFEGFRGIAIEKNRKQKGGAV